MIGFLKKYREGILLVLLILLQLTGVTWLQTTIRNGGDGLFTFLLANNPYEFNYVDYTWKYYPESNGWIDNRILTEQYTVMSYDRFDLASVYWHQRIDNHPIFYYSLVHLICSLFPGQYSQMYAMVINTVFLIGIDLLIIGILGVVFPKKRLYAAPAILLLSLLYCYQRLGDLPRMYMMLAFFCAWYLYLHVKVLASEEAGKRFLLPWFFCVLAGSLTHYYFYVFGFFVSLYYGIFLLLRRQIRLLLSYLMTGIMAVSASLIAFPWVIWHIWFNQMGKHQNVIGWSIERLAEYLQFLNRLLWNRRFPVFAVILLCTLLLHLKGRGHGHPGEDGIDAARKRIFGLFLCSGLCTATLLFTLDGPVFYYLTPSFLPMILCMILVMIDLAERLCDHLPQDRVNKHRYGWICILTLLMALLTAGTKQSADNIASHRNTAEVNREFRRISEAYAGEDCLYIEEEQNNLLEGLFFDFSTYDEIKKVSADDLSGILDRGETDQLLAGRKSEGKVLIYSRDTYDREMDAVLIATPANYRIWLWEKN